MRNRTMHDHQNGTRRRRFWWLGGHPCVATHTSAGTRTERLQSPEERARYDESTKCILCGACTGSCPQVWANPRWVGPASIVNAHRFIFDSRDEGAAERLRILSDNNGAWPCKTIFNCTECCPRGIPVTDTIEQVKRAILYGTNETE